MILNTVLASATMADKLALIVPEIVLFIATVAALVLGSSQKRSARSLCAPVTFGALVLAGLIAVFGPTLDASPVPGLMTFGKALVAAVGALLVLLMAGTIDRNLDHDAIERGALDAARANVGEFYAFFLFSLTGLMLCCSADDLIWLFLALELTSLPTYVMVSISTPRARSQEAGVKYFFLGAFGAAIFLYGFALLYGACGTTQLFAPAGDPSITASLAAQVAETGAMSPIALLGMVLAIVGVCFKIAAVPMHFYTPDVYQGAATPVAAFLAFVPKMAGFVALMLLLSAIGWTHGPDGAALPEAIRITLWVIAALTMTVGNVLAILQNNVKRILAYSSVAHSGYMLVGLIAGPGSGDPANNGLAAVLFYMLCYGFMNLGAFAVLACLERRSGDDAEIEDINDLRGLCAAQPLLGWTMVLCAASLLGLPPLLGFFGKFYLFTSAIAAGEIALVVVLGVNSAIAAFYYLRLVATPLLEEPDDQTRSLTLSAFPTRLLAAVVSAASVVVLVPFASSLMEASDKAASASVDSAAAETAQADPPADPARRPSP